jgi:hypothetical protein
VIFLATLESILSKPAQAVLTAQGADRGCVHAPQVNRAGSYVTVLEHIVTLLGNPRLSPGQTLAAIERLMLTTPAIHRLELGGGIGLGIEQIGP